MYHLNIKRFEKYIKSHDKSGPSETFKIVLDLINYPKSMAEKFCQ